MKNILITFIIGVAIGVIITLIFYTKVNTLNETSLQIVSSNPNANISEEKIEIKNKPHYVIATSSFLTDEPGTFTTSFSIPKSELQYNHSLQYEFLFLVNSQTPLLSLGYGYKSFSAKLYAGYSLAYNQLDYGLGVGYTQRF